MNTIPETLNFQPLATKWAGQGLIDYHPSLPSTNSRLKQLAREGAPKGSLCLCLTQTAGRGRLDRQWLSTPGEALTFSLLMQPALPADKLPLCTFAAALAARQAIRRLCPGLLPGVKWPNDLVLEGKKCAGILSELTFAPDGSPSVVMGVGLNVLQQRFPEEIISTATSLRLSLQDQKAACPAPGKLLSVFLEELETATFLMETNFSRFLAAYREASLTLGKTVQVTGKEESFAGSALDIDETGALIVLTSSGEKRRLLSGDVSVRGVMGYV